VSRVISIYISPWRRRHTTEPPSFPSSLVTTDDAHYLTITLL